MSFLMGFSRKEKFTHTKEMKNEEKKNLMRHKIFIFFQTLIVYMHKMHLFYLMDKKSNI